jgi:hypothetical protein
MTRLSGPPVNFCCWAGVTRVDSSRRETLMGRRMVAALLVASGALAPATVVQTSVAAASPAPLIRTDPGRIHFSPNGDGRKDVGRVGFRLARAAEVSVLVRQRSRLVRGPVSLGVLRAGHHSWRWLGRGNAGRVVRDGAYRVLIRATDHGTTKQARTTAVVKTVGDRGKLVSTRPIVYPRATVVDDHVRVSYLRKGWNQEADAYGDTGVIAAPNSLRATIEIRDPDGHVVRRQRFANDYTPSIDWYATKGGRPLPSGRYVARVAVTDPAGNRTSARLPLTVSPAQLVEESWTTTLAAGDIAGFDPNYDPGCNGCGEGCGPTPSARFPGGESFGPCDAYGYHPPTFRYYGTDVPFAEAPIDSYRITATGGPTTAGATDVGWLDTVQTAPGDGSTAGSWRVVDLEGGPFLPRLDTPVTWLFATEYPNSYDVASFTVEYRHYVPAG